MKYNQLPVSLGIHDVKVQEMFFYQYLPIKLSGEVQPLYEERLKIFDNIVGAASCDFIGVFGLNRYVESNVYLTAKNLYQTENCGLNRPGWHSDGFMTDDINYIWCNTQPTVFNNSDFKLSQDHEKSLLEMNAQALYENSISGIPCELLRLNQFVIHKTADVIPGMRCFIKISFSNDKYNLIGNSHNHLLNYDWEMKPRSVERNHPVKNG